MGITSLVRLGFLSLWRRCVNRVYVPEMLCVSAPCAMIAMVRKTNGPDDKESNVNDV
ncbi:hypothetical protein HMPREF9997_00248 [Corynebacterium durum F0235]|uniref:Uncharacterized protein n=1 Tax=Corynebacterium durum F0235 TaxID=1035195 RepID=L1MLQ2_9CORY|nr:hypothetical protein HMPREF9997_00248 [Corynebacterium durum F0235]